MWARWLRAKRRLHLLELRRSLPEHSQAGASPRQPPMPLFTEVPTPSEIKDFLDEYVIGQDEAKKPRRRRAESLQATA